MNETGARRLLISIEEARQTLGGIGRTTTYELVKRGDLVKVKIGRRGFITARSLDRYVESLPEDGAL